MRRHVLYEAEGEALDEDSTDFSHAYTVLYSHPCDGSYATPTAHEYSAIILIIIAVQFAVVGPRS